MRGWFATFALIGALLLAGCTSTSGHPAGPTAPPTSAGPATTPPVTASQPATDPSTRSVPARPVGTEVPADVPTTGPNLRHKGERPPVMPLLATQHTPAGAVAFAKFFELTIDWAYATTSTTYMRHYYESTCVTCRSIQLGVDGAANKHRHFIGGRLIIDSAKDEGPDSSYGGQRSVLVRFTVPAAEVVDQYGTFIDGEPALHLKDRIHLRWAADGWQVAEVGPEQ